MGDFGTIGYFQFMEIDWPVSLIMIPAIMNGIIKSVILETIILSKPLPNKLAFKTAIGMTLVSMISVEATMILTDLILTVAAILT